MQFLTHPEFKAGLEEYLTEAGTAAIVLGTRRCVAAAATTGSRPLLRQQGLSPGALDGSRGAEQQHQWRGKCFVLC